MAAPARLVVGLGNPGPDYAATRHNIGFMAVDSLALPKTGWVRKFGGETRSATLDGVACLLLKPMTFMNLSGGAVAEALRFYRLQPEDVVVFHDDLDLLPGKVRVKQGGGAAGHNGLKSLDEHIGPAYWRVRLGIGRPERKEQVHDYVLAPFAKADQAWLAPLLQAVADALPAFLKDGPTPFLARINKALAKPQK